MRPVSRRTALTLGGLGLAGTLVGATGLWRQLSSTTPRGGPSAGTVTEAASPHRSHPTPVCIRGAWEPRVGILVGQRTLGLPSDGAGRQ